MMTPNLKNINTSILALLVNVLPSFYFTSLSIIQQFSLIMFNHLNDYIPKYQLLDMQSNCKY